MRRHWLDFVVLRYAVTTCHAHSYHIGEATLTIASNDAGREFQSFFVDGAVDQRQRSFVTDRSQMHETAAVAFEKSVFTFLSTNDHLEVRPWSKVSPDLEKHDVVQLVIALCTALPEILQFARVRLVGQEATTSRGLRIVHEAVFLCQCHLRFAISTAESV